MLTTNSTISHLECSLTSEKFDHNLLYNLSPVSKKPLFAKYDLEKASKTYNIIRKLQQSYQTIGKVQKPHKIIKEASTNI